ncbi:MAG: Na+/H+ antiporter [Pseudomonadota bacterium]|nr:Na+/H+ antiporter [Pseudomonadota bacterium]
METTGIVLTTLLAVVLSGFLARVSRMPAPLVQIALGAAIFYSGLAAVVLEPQVFFLLFLPPLLFLDGWRLPKDDLLRDAPTVLKLALGLVVFTVLGMGFFIHWLVPSMPLAVSFALAAIMSPTDPIAVSAIAGRAKIPLRLLHILQGEALLNDASGLICMRFAIAAALTGEFSPAHALQSFLWMAIGGLAIGAVATWVLVTFTSRALVRSGEDGSGQILSTLLIPFGVYLLAERLRASGILAAVAAGVTMSFTHPSHWRAATRLSRTAVWDTVQFAANGSIFVLLGEQIPALLATALPGNASAQPAWWPALDVLVIVIALAVLRFAWVWTSLQMSLLRARRLGVACVPTSWRMVLAISIAGVRGAVTLAGVLTLPLTMSDGTPFPSRELAVLLAAGVTLLSLVFATLGLPRVLHGLDLPAERPDVDAQSRARTAGAEAAILAIESAQLSLADDDPRLARHAGVSKRLVDMYQQRIGRWAGGDAAAEFRVEDDDIEHQLRRVGLRAERVEILRSRHRHGVGDLALRELVRELDLQETRYGG